MAKILRSQDAVIGTPTVADLSFPNLADEAVAFQIAVPVPVTVSGTRLTVYEDRVLVLKGRVAITTGFGGVGEPFPIDEAIRLTGVVVERVVDVPGPILPPSGSPSPRIRAARLPTIDSATCAGRANCRYLQVLVSGFVPGTRFEAYAYDSAGNHYGPVDIVITEKGEGGNSFFVAGPPRHLGLGCDGRRDLERRHLVIRSDRLEPRCPGVGHRR